ncbi:MAG: ATP-binding protein [Bacteroidetes bacterium]|nr:ATP-binding protein [Bacteroidota bacterium]
MATADQLKTLIKSHFDNEVERFNTVSLQIAAHEAQLGHINIADEIRKLVEKSKLNIPRLKHFSNDFQGLILESKTDNRFNDLVVSDQLKARIERILNEDRQKVKLKKHGLDSRRKILLAGAPGTGKTMTASIIAHELGLPLYTILMDKMVTKFMGETSAKLRQVFEFIQERKGVYLFDEFDAIGGERGKDNDVGEMRRVLNSFLQFIERDHSDSIIVAATNNIRLLDSALFRRFDDVLQYNLPTKAEMVRLMENKLGKFKGDYSLPTIVKPISKLSHAEVSQASIDAIKATILADKDKVERSLLIKMLNDRTETHNRKRK